MPTRRCRAWTATSTRFGRSPAKACSRCRSGPFTRASSSLVISGSVWPESRCSTCSSGCSTSTRASRSASSGSRGRTRCSWRSRSPGTRLWGMRSRTATPSSGWPASRCRARAQALRVVLLELERLYNHIADIGALATDVAFTVPASRAQAQREGLVRLYERLFGTRLLRGTIAFGGVKHDLDTGRTRCPAPPSAHARAGVRQPDHVADRFRLLHGSRRHARGS